MKRVHQNITCHVLRLSGFSYLYLSLSQIIQYYTAEPRQLSRLDTVLGIHNLFYGESIQLWWHSTVAKRQVQLGVIPHTPKIYYNYGPVNHKS